MKRLNYTKLEVTLLKSPVCLRNSSPMNPPHVLGIPVDVTPPCPRNSSRRNPPSPSEFRDAARGMGMDIFWNHPFIIRFFILLGITVM